MTKFTLNFGETSALKMEHYRKPEPDWDQTLTIIRVNEEKISEELATQALHIGIRKKL